MEALVLTSVVTLGIVLAFTLPGWRLKRVLARPFPSAWRALLRRNLPIYSRMAPDLQKQLHQRIKQFLHQKKFVGCAGQEIDDEVRLTIAAGACLLLLNRKTEVYPGLDTILVYPTAFVVPRKQVDEAGVITEERQDLLGESWGDGRVILSWDHVRHGSGDWTDGQNVVLHEFAHQLDSESGSTNGAPYLGSNQSYQEWSEVLSEAFERLQHDAMFHQHSVLDHYGAHSPAEFFAVATETFFEKPYQMAERHPGLFAELHKFYRVDPREWQDAPAPAMWNAPSYGEWH
jgi:hypothetical protein